MTYFLEKIRQSVLERVHQMKLEAHERFKVNDFCAIFHEQTSPVIIAEIKFSSPSRGGIYQGALTPVEIAASYIDKGARALSVLTEPNYFKGHIQILHDIHQAMPDCPILLKDFVLSPLQIQQAYLSGASAVLLIVGFLNPSLLVDLYGYAESLGLTPLIEVHDEEELCIARALKPKLIGINNRNLKTLTIDHGVCQNLIHQVPDDVLVVCESGITKPAEIQKMQELGCDGFLIGSHFMQSNDPGEALHTLLKGVEHAR